jgi:hypothetical protein
VNRLRANARLRAARDEAFAALDAALPPRERLNDTVRHRLCMAICLLESASLASGRATERWSQERKIGGRR